MHDEKEDEGEVIERNIENREVVVTEHREIEIRMRMQKRWTCRNMRTST